MYDVTVIAPSGNMAVLPQAYEVLDYNTYNDLYAYPIDFVVEAVNTLRLSISKSVYSGAEARLSLVVRRLGTRTEPPAMNPFTVAFYTVNPLLNQNAIPIDQVTMDPLGPNKMARSPYVYWRPTKPGITYLYAKIDTTNSVQEIPAANENNNVVSRIVWVLPGFDTIPPVVNNVTITGPEGQWFSSSRKVRITTLASDNIAVTGLLFTEYVFVQSRGNWEPVQSTGWLPYSTSSLNFSWLLDPTPGVHYIKVWAADRAGNISLNSGMSFINYMPERDYLAAGEYRVFHQYLNARDPVTLTLKRYYGSAILYVWSPDPKIYGSVQDPAGSIDYCAPVTGLYQYEVEGVRRLLFRGGTSYHFSVATAKECPPLLMGDPSLMGRTAPGTASLPADDDTGVPSAPAPVSYIPIIMK
jgi:hypothetical protein